MTRESNYGEILFHLDISSWFGMGEWGRGEKGGFKILMFSWNRKKASQPTAVDRAM